MIIKRRIKARTNKKINIFSNRILLKNISKPFKYESNNNSKYLKSNKCCLVKKKYDDENGNFNYIYQPLENENCDINLYELDQNNQLLFDGINNWSNDNCINSSELNKNVVLGSCRRSTYECIDFISKKDCEKINDKLRWSEKTCQDRIYSVK